MKQKIESLKTAARAALRAQSISHDAALAAANNGADLSAPTHQAMLAEAQANSAAAEKARAKLYRAQAAHLLRCAAGCMEASRDYAAAARRARANARRAKSK